MRILLAHAEYATQKGGEEGDRDATKALLESVGHAVFLLNVPNADYSARRLAQNYFWSSDTYKLMVDAIMTKFPTPDIVHFINTHASLGPCAIRAAHACGVPIVQSVANYRLTCAAATLWREGKLCVECVGKTMWPLSSTSLAWPGVLHGCYRGSRLATAPIALGTAYHRWRGTYDLIDIVAPVSGYVQDVLHNAGYAMPLPIHPPAVYPEPEAQLEPPTVPSFLYVGRLTEEKGVRTLLEAWQRMGKEAPGLLVIGDGPLVGDVKAAPGYQAKIFWRSHVPHDEVLTRMRNVTAVIVPSLWPDPAPRVALEALACGTPTIVSDVGGLPELQPTAKFPAGDVTRLVQIVGIMARCPPAEMRELRAGARLRYEQHFDAQIALARLERLYARAIELRAGRRRVAA